MLKWLFIFGLGLILGGVATYRMMGPEGRINFSIQSATEAEEVNDDIDGKDPDGEIDPTVFAQKTNQPTTTLAPFYVPCPASRELLALGNEVKVRINTSQIQTLAKNSKERKEVDFRPLFRSKIIERKIESITARYIPSKENSKKDQHLCIYPGAKLQLRPTPNLFCSPKNEKNAVGFTCAYKQVSPPQN